jgi:hypothetical protein
VLTVLRGGYHTEILRKIWFDRADLQVSQLEDFAPYGILLSDIRFSDWRAVDASATPNPSPIAGTASNNASNSATDFAHTISIDRPHDDYKLDLQINKITLNDPIAAAKFQLEQPAGSELVHVGEDSQPQNPATAKDHQR